MSNISNRILAIASSALIALALPTGAMAAKGGGGGGGGGGGHSGGGGGGGHFSGGGGAAHFSSGGAHFSGASFSRGAASVSRGPVFTRSFSHSAIGVRSFSGARFNHVHTFSGSHVRAFTGNRVHTLSGARTFGATRWNHGALGTHALAGAHVLAPGARMAALSHVNTSGWHRHDWWRHRGFFGWIGPLFWPFFYDDLWYDVFWGYGPYYWEDPFWAYGYGDIYGAMFSPYGYDDLAGWASGPTTASVTRYGPNRTVRTAPSQQAGQPTQWSAMCGGDTRVVDLPIDQISTAVAPTPEQRAALDALANASVQAAQIIKAACPTDVAHTATGRMDAMEQRVTAMVQAVALIRDPLDKFYALLTDEQKARFNALGESARAANNPQSPTQACGPNAAAIPTWPQARIENAVRPNEGQRALLGRLKDASAQAADMLKAACPAETPATPPARIAAVAQRLDALLAAVKLVHAALNEFYASLTDEQKAQFNGVAPIVQNTPRG